MKFLHVVLLILPALSDAANKAATLQRLMKSEGSQASHTSHGNLRDGAPDRHRRLGKKSKWSSDDHTTDHAGFGKTDHAHSDDYGEGAESCNFLEVAFRASDFDNPELAFIDGDHEGDHGTFGGFGIPIYDSMTMTQIGTLKEFYNWVPENDCTFSGVWTFDGSSDKYGYGQMFYNGSCKGEQSGISGGTFDYSCASGFDFMFTQNQNTGVVFWHIYDCGGCARSLSTL